MRPLLLGLHLNQLSCFRHMKTKRVLNVWITTLSVSHGVTVTKLLDTEPASCYSQAKKVPFARDFLDNFLVIYMYGNDILALTCITD